MQGKRPHSLERAGAMKFLEQTEEQQQADAERYARARSRAVLRGLVPVRKADRLSDFVERAIDEVTRQLEGEHEDETRAHLEARLAHLLEEREARNTQTANS
jgi:hypothetical protein